MISGLLKSEIQIISQSEKKKKLLRGIFGLYTCILLFEQYNITFSYVSSLWWGLEMPF